MVFVLNAKNNIKYVSSLYRREEMIKIIYRDYTCVEQELIIMFSSSSSTTVVVVVVVVVVFACSILIFIIISKINYLKIFVAIKNETK